MLAGHRRMLRFPLGKWGTTISQSVTDPEYLAGRRTSFAQKEKDVRTPTLNHRMAARFCGCLKRALDQNNGADRNAGALFAHDVSQRQNRHDDKHRRENRLIPAPPGRMREGHPADEHHQEKKDRLFELPEKHSRPSPKTRRRLTGLYHDPSPAGSPPSRVRFILARHIPRHVRRPGEDRSCSRFARGRPPRRGNIEPPEVRTSTPGLSRWGDEQPSQPAIFRGQILVLFNSNKYGTTPVSSNKLSRVPIGR